MNRRWVARTRRSVNGMAANSLRPGLARVQSRVGSEVRVGSQLYGIVRKLNVTVGSHVEAGAVIAQIDDRTIQARLADGQAQAELDRTSMERTRVSYERARVLAAKRVVAV